MEAKKPAPNKKKSAKAEARPVGRPTDYREQYAEQAYKLCLLGATDKKMADFFGVSEQTLNAWKVAQPQFLESITRGKEIADAEIAEALFHRAKGYSHPEDDIRTVSNGPTGSEIVITPTIKHYPRDKQDIEHTGKDGGPIKTESKVDIDMSGLTTEQLRAISSIKLNG
jgi:hypothetical protein